VERLVERSDVHIRGGFIVSREANAAHHLKWVTRMITGDEIEIVTNVKL
jgi:16S rRNA U1498 N3-methylase RsmE